MDIRTLHPTDATSAAAREAFDRIAAAIAEAEGKITEASGRRETLMIEGSAKEVRKAEQDVADAQLDLDRLKLLAERVREQAAAAEARERRETAEREHAAVAEAIATHVAKTEKELPKLTAPLRQLLAERVNLIHRARAANEQGAEFEMTRFDANALAVLLSETMLPRTEAEKAEAARQREAEAAEDREIRAESLRRRQREIEEHAARERAREGGPKLERAGRVEFPAQGPIVRLAGSARS